MNFNAEIYSYARTRGLFGGIALDGSVISIDRSANASLYHKSGVTATEIFSGQAPAPPADRAAFSRTVGSSDRNRGAHLARAAGRSIRRPRRSLRAPYRQAPSRLAPIPLEEQKNQ